MEYTRIKVNPLASEENLKQISEQLQLMGEVSLGGGAQADIRTVTTHGGGESWGRGPSRYQNSYNSWGR